jgi:alkylation response protein AidB-like acyl-CoA dehydrogenase
MGYMEYKVAIEELAKVCGSIGLSMAAHNSLCTNHILMFGSEEQKIRFLPQLASGEHIGAWGLTEANTGSDAMRMQCTAARDESRGGWILNGTKNWITHGLSSDVSVVLARTGDLLDSHGITAFVVLRDQDGFKGGKKENKLGMRSSETAEMIFEDCFVPDDQVLGNTGDGFIQAMKILDGGRISIASLALGIAKGAFECAKDYSKEREQFGKPISRFQAISFKLADMYTQIEAADLLTLQACWRKEKGMSVTKESAIAKYEASETSVKVATEGVQILGGYGYTKDFPAEKYYRDSKLCTIGEGTSEIQKLVISRELLKDE